MQHSPALAKIFFPQALQTLKATQTPTGTSIRSSPPHSGQTKFALTI